MEKISQNLSSTINLTGYRLLSLLHLLMQGGISKEEIIKNFEKDEYIKEISSDTIRLDINTLKHAGFEIESLLSKNGYIYVLKSNPLEIKFTKEDVRTINKIKRVVLDLWNWEKIISLYETLEKITHFIHNEEYKNSILNFGYFMQIDFNLLKELHRHSINKDEIMVSYNSPKNGIMHIKIRTYYIHQDKQTNKLHLIGQFEHYDYLSYLRVDKIIKIDQIFLKPTIKPLDEKFKTYKVKNTINFEPVFNEEIIEETPDYLTIKTKIVNDFQYIQRILSQGDNIVEIDNQTREEILKNLLKTKEIY